MNARAQTVTILFTDLVGSTELLQRAGDERAQRIFKAHHRLLREAVEAHHGHEVKWLGDGLMVAFDSAADAVRCAIEMQQSSPRPTAGERLEIRAGLNVGEAFVDEADYFGSSVVIARRLCDRASAGQIFASDIVVRLLGGRGADVETRDLGALELKGITNTVPSVEIVYQHDHLALLRKLPFVGRQAEYETLVSKLSMARSGRGSVVLLAGEPGIGKTRLTEEFCELASTGATVIRGNCYEGDLSASFGPWTEALRSLVEQTPDSGLRGALGPGAQAIALMVGEVGRRLPDLEPAPRLDPESERARLFESIGAFLRNAAGLRPLVIFFDDLHWCDRPSLAMLEQVSRTIADKPIVIIGTYRDVEVDRAHPLAQTLTSMRRMEHHERLAIRGFSKDSVLELIAAIEPADSPGLDRHALATALQTEADGNPFFIREILNNLVESGTLEYRDGALVQSPGAIGDLGIPEGVRELIGRRLSRLSDGCNRVLQRVSAMSSGFTWDELQAICDDREEELLNYLDEALSSQLIEERGRLRYEFTHALIRATLYDELNGPRRVLLHRRLAESLEVLYASELDQHVGELASHYMASAGGEARKAIEYSIRAGDLAMQAVAWEDALSHYERAVEAMDFSKSPHDEARCRVLLAMSDCHYYFGNPAANLSLMRDCAAAARAIGSIDCFARAVAAFDIAADALPDDLSVERLSLLDETLAMLGDADSAHKALVLAFRARAAAAFANARSGLPSAGFMAWAGSKDPEVLAQSREALALAERTGDNRAIAIASYFYHMYSWSPDNDDERLVVIDRGLQAARETEIGARLAIDLSGVRAGDLLALGNIEEFRRCADTFASDIERFGYSSQRYLAAALRLVLDIGEGRLTQAEVRLAETAAAGDATPTGAVTSIGQTFFLRMQQGRLGEMEMMWQAVVGGFQGIHVMQSGLVLIQSWVGKDSAARSAIDELCADDFAAIPRDFLWLPTLAILADACAEIGHDAQAARFYAALRPREASCATIIQIISLGSVARVVGRMATMLQHWDEAEQHFEVALAANEQMGFHAWTAWTRLHFGEMLLRRNYTGDRERGTNLLRQALDFARRAGMAKVQTDAERLLAGV